MPWPSWKHSSNSCLTAITESCISYFPAVITTYFLQVLDFEKFFHINLLESSKREFWQIPTSRSEWTHHRWIALMQSNEFHRQGEELRHLVVLHVDAKLALLWQFKKENSWICRMWTMIVYETRWIFECISAIGICRSSYFEEVINFLIARNLQEISDDYYRKITHANCLQPWLLREDYHWCCQTGNFLLP